MSGEDLLDGLARWAALHGHGVYRPDTPYLDGEVAIMLGAGTPRPDAQLVVRPYLPGREPDTRLPFSEPFVQWRVRGDGDERSSRLRAQALFDDLHGAMRVTLPGGVLVLSMICLHADPIPLGRDESGRWEHTVNTRIEYLRTSTLRPAE